MVLGAEVKIVAIPFRVNVHKIVEALIFRGRLDVGRLENSLNKLPCLCFHVGFNSVGHFGLRLPWRFVDPPFSSSSHATSSQGRGVPIHRINQNTTTSLVTANFNSAPQYSQSLCLQLQHHLAQCRLSYGLALDKDHHRKPGRVAFRLSQWVAFLLTFTTVS